MMRRLDDLFLLAEIDAQKIWFTSSEMRRRFRHQVITIKHTAFIYKSAIPSGLHSHLTDLSGFVMLREFADHSGLDARTLLRRVDFMKKTGVSLFEYMEHYRNYYIKLSPEKQILFQEKQGFAVSLNDIEPIEESIMIGDLVVGFR